MILYRTVKYLKYILLARHRKGHGIHSPFVFDLIERVFRNKIAPDIVFSIERIRKNLITDPREITVNDLGKGSENKKSELRKVSYIARNSPVPEKYGILLSNLASEYAGHSVLELGTSLGISSMYLAGGAPDVFVKTVEGCPEISQIAMDNFKQAGIRNIELFTGAFDEFLPVLMKGADKPGLVFIDGDHRKEPLLRYFTCIAEMSDEKTVVVIDDIYYSEEMEEAWNIIKQFENVSVTIDIFRMGIVFFRRGITHNNYIIRY